jgi:hypothetical protein
MKRYSNLTIPVALMAVAGGCFGMLRSFGSDEGGFYSAIMSANTVRAYYPFSLFPEQVGSFLDLAHLLLVVASLGLALWVWTSLGGRELIEAFRGGASTMRTRSLFLRVLIGGACFAGLAGLCTESDLHNYGRFESAWLQAAGLLSFAPAAWALTRQRQLLALLHRSGDQPLNATEFRLVAALASPIVTASVLSTLIPASLLHETINGASSILLYSTRKIAEGPWVVTAACSALFAVAGLGLGLVFSALRSTSRLQRRAYQLSSVAFVAAVSQVIASAPTNVLQSTEVDTASPVSSYNLVALDSTVPSQEVRYHRGIRNVGYLSTPVSKKHDVENQARIQMLDWQPNEAMRTLATSPDAWFSQSWGVLAHLAQISPVDLKAVMPSQLAVLATGYTSRYSQKENRSWMEPATSCVVVKKVVDRQENLPNHLSTLAGQIQLDGRPLVNARLRLQPVQMNSGTYATVQQSMARHLSGESFLGTSLRGDWAFRVTLCSFYAMTSTDSQGRFQLDGIEPGQYELVLRNEGPTAQVSKAPGLIMVGQDQSLTFNDIQLSTTVH